MTTIELYTHSISLESFDPVPEASDLSLTVNDKIYNSNRNFFLIVLIYYLNSFNNFLFYSCEKKDRILWFRYFMADRRDLSDANEISYEEVNDVKLLRKGYINTVSYQSVNSTSRSQGCSPPVTRSHSFSRKSYIILYKNLELPKTIF